MLKGYGQKRMDCSRNRRYDVGGVVYWFVVVKKLAGF